jgi:photoactive yellow protein
MTDEATGAGALPFGYLSLDEDGTVNRYNPFGAEGASVDPDAVVGKNFFSEVFASPEIEKLEARFKEFLKGSESPSMSANVDLKRGPRSLRIHVGFVRSPLKDEVIVTVNPVGHEDLPLSAQIRPDPVHGTLSDSAGQMVVVANEDFWSGFLTLLETGAIQDDGTALHKLGKEWGLAHALRVESFVQRESSNTLGELQIQIALEYLSGSLAIVGLGNFDVDFAFRQRGIVIINHRSSPFPTLMSGGSDHACHLLAGFHAGLLSYLSGRSLHGLELYCSQGGEDHCRFLIATQDRLSALSASEPHPSDEELLNELRTHSASKDGDR